MPAYGKPVLITTLNKNWLQLEIMVLPLITVYINILQKI